ncbi:hypothetical protein [Glaciecola petra]|uniref:Uncharacterized protein n=1 Tax=Glaciecola petra TaxID=3075602 RepID=A0ABU2ZLA3_9ALTE|nr:hypothetical protein [Aestuariibacter sp. P117]MDT0593398.1 hypothetical protein [Aestuariibacter sp. P117]
MKLIFNFAVWILLLGALLAFFDHYLDEEDVYRKESNGQSSVYFVGEITPPKVDKALNLLRPDDKLIIDSGGGDMASAMRLGNFMIENNTVIEVLDLCMSSCANYLFVAASKKILNRSSLVVYHGGPRQANILKQLEAAFNGRNNLMSVGRLNYEMVIVENNLSDRVERLQQRSNCPQMMQIRDRFGQCVPFTAEIYLADLLQIEEQYYNKISPALDKNIPYYGQWNEYESIYQSYKYYGFYYDISSLRQMGVDNIEVKGKEWLPEANPFIDWVYQVRLN